MSYFVKNYSYNPVFLSIGRIFTALIILIDLYYRFQNLEAHYTSKGVLPSFIIKNYYPFYQYYFSIHTFFDSLLAQKIIFITHFIAAFMLLLGFKTRLFTVINFLLLLSLHHRNPVILQGGDDLLRITLFYMIFLPWGEYYSLDKKFSFNKGNQTKTNDTVFSWMYVVFLINVAFVYLFSALLKTSEEWRINGNAIYYALSLDTLRTSFGTFLYPYYPVLKILSYIVYYIFEIIVPVLLILSPSVHIRNIAVVLIIVLHTFIILSLKVGIFPYVGICTAFMLLNINKYPASRALQFQQNEFYFAIIIFILILRYNLATLNNHWFSITLLEDRVLNSIGLSQRWNMFSPGVKKYDGWLVLRGIKKDNSEWDLIHNTPKIHYEKTEKNFNFLKGDRWRKFLENYEQVQYNFLKPYFCYYLISNWNTNHPNDSIETLNILYVKKTNLPNYKYKTEIENLCLCNPKIDNYNP
ncbi:MAG: HTTM domain-containing protein [Bacteroidia bacterium]|nr:HTTM domain-containing protein [Bacteroidia bacterium]